MWKSCSFLHDLYGFLGFSEWHTKCDSLSHLLALRDEVFSPIN